MCCRSVFTLFMIMSTRKPVEVLCDFSTYHDDFSLKPEDGVLPKNTFNWLGFVEYIHVATGLQHGKIAPRVVLIQKQFVIGTAADLLSPPKDYKLGNVLFGEYEREEDECRLTLKQLKDGETCPYASLEIPLESITPHPEYPRFGVKNSLALVKLIRPINSNYMTPICLPSKFERRKKRRNKSVFMVDYLSRSPEDFDIERMGKKTLQLYTQAECIKHRAYTMPGAEGVSNVLCTSGCGMRRGAPIVSQTAEGAFELIGIAAAGGSLCSKRSMRRRLIADPPIYIDVYPYKSWIINFITAHELPLPYPRSFKHVDGGSSIGLYKDFLRTKKQQKEGWHKRVYYAGNVCYRNQERQKKYAFFYREKFQVHGGPSTVSINMTISAGIECTIVCARLSLPNKLVVPIIKGIGMYHINVLLDSVSFPESFTYTLGLLGKNSTKKNLEAWMPLKIASGDWHK